MSVIVNVTPSAQHIKSGGTRRIFLLLEVMPGIIEIAENSVKQRGVSFIIDRSGSMSEPTSNGRSKISEAISATNSAIDMLEPGDLVSVYAFDTEVSVLAQAANVGFEREAIKRTIQQLRIGGSTQIAPAISITNLRPGMTWRNILLTDGNSTVNRAEDERRCLSLVGTPGAAPIGIFGLGIDYNDQYLASLAQAGQPGSFYQHVSDASQLAAKFGEQMQILTSSGDISDVKISFITMDAVKIVEAARLVPDQQDIPVEMDGAYINCQHGDLDGVYGQKILLVLDVQTLGLQNGPIQIGEWAVQYTEGNQRKTFTGSEFLEVTDDEALAFQHDPAVLRTFFTVRGTRLATQGDYSGAAELMTRAGNTNAANQLRTLAGGRSDENTRRSTNTLLTNLPKTIKPS